MICHIAKILGKLKFESNFLFSQNRITQPVISHTSSVYHMFPYLQGK